MLPFLKSQGVNAASVKVAVNPSDNDRQEKNLCNLSDAITTLKAAKKAGMNTNMVLMYSDWVTSSSDQSPSESWNAEAWIQGEGEDEDSGASIDYTNSVIEELKKSGFTPDMITIGNDVNYNFLGYSGDNAWKCWKAIGDISNLIRNYNKDVKIGIGISAPGDAKDASKGSEIQ